MGADAAIMVTILYFCIAVPISSFLLIGYSIRFYHLSRTIAQKKKKFVSTSSHRAIVARHPIIIYLYILSILLIILVERPVTTYCMIANQCRVFNDYISPVLFALTVFGHFYLFLVRTWILYFEIQFNLAKKDIMWQKHLYLNYLSPSNAFNKSKQDWFLENKHTFGCIRWLFTKILCIPFVVSSAISIAVGVSMSYHHPLWWWLANGVLLAFPVFGILFIWKAINPIHDFYRIRAEMRVTLLLWIIICIFLILHLIMFDFISQYKDYYELSYAIRLWEVGVCLTINGLISTAWVSYLTKHKYFEYSPEFVSFEMAKLQRTFEGKSMLERVSSKIVPFASTSRILSAVSSSNEGAMNWSSTDGIHIDSNVDEGSYNKSQSSKNNTEIAEKIYNTFPLRDILVTDTGFRLFMQHMTSEYSAESLLFLVEIVRYKYAMNGFKPIEMYSDSASVRMIDEVDNGLVVEDEKLNINLEWYMPLPASLLDNVVKPPDIDKLKSVEIDISQRRRHQSSGSMTTFNPLFHSNANIDSEAKQDGTLNEIEAWDDAQIAWGTLSHALMIYSKYIAFGALFEINISHRMRHKMKIEFANWKTLYMENHQVIVSGTLEDIMTGYAKFDDNIHIFAKYPEKRKELQHIFDQVAIQIESLINDSYLRFRQTRTYHRLLKQLVKKQRKKSKHEKAFRPKRSSSKKISMSVK
eukprot:516167_1